MPEPMQTNHLYYGDNLDILRRYLPETGDATDNQLLAFEDTWLVRADADAV